jgi:hypothetical protein
MQSIKRPETHSVEGAMHLSDAALGAVLDPAGGGAAGTAALAHAACCAECSQAIQAARTADRDVAELLAALDHPRPVLHFSAIAERAGAPDSGLRRTPQPVQGPMRMAQSRNRWAAAGAVHLARKSVVQWVAILLGVTAMVAVAAVPRSPVRHLITAWISPNDRSSEATIPVASAASKAGAATATTPRGVAIIARGAVVVTIRVPQANGAIRLTTAAADGGSPRVSVLASGDGASYLVSQDTIAIDNRAEPNLDYDVTLPPALQLPVVSVWVAGRVVFARHGLAIVTTGVKQAAGSYAIPLSVVAARKY